MISSEIEVPILQILYPPNGSIPAAHVDKVPAIRQHISARAILAGDGQAPKRSRRVLDPDESAALNAKIIELRETPLPDGLIRTWDQISEELGRSITALAARKRYAAAKKAKVEFEMLARATLAEMSDNLPQGNSRDEPDVLKPEVEPEPVPESAPPKSLESPQIKEPSPLTEAEIDAELIRLRDSGLDNKEIRDAMLRQGVDFGLVELRHRLAVLARKAPPAKSASDPEPEIPPDLNRTGLDVVMWRLWDHGKGKTPGEISDLLCNAGYSYGRSQVERRLEQQGAKL